MVLTSGCNHPILMRAPMAMQHIGLVLGLEFNYLKKVIVEIPRRIITQNEKKLQAGFVMEGIEIVQEDFTAGARLILPR